MAQIPEVQEFLVKRRAQHRGIRQRDFKYDPESIEFETISRKDDVDIPLGYFLKTASSDNAPVLMYIHGGGFYCGFVEDYFGYLGPIGRDLGVNVFLAKYRHTPEVQFPENVKDVCDGYEWLVNDKKIDSDDIVVWGDSAGGGLAALLCNALNGPYNSHAATNHSDNTFYECRIRLPQPRALILGSPWLDLTESAPSMKKNVLNWTYRLLFCGDGHTPKSISPIFMTPNGFPETFIVVGSTEILLGDSQKFTKSLEACGVKTLFKVYENMSHCAYPHQDPKVMKANEKFHADRTIFLKKVFSRSVKSNL